MTSPPSRLPQLFVVLTVLVLGAFFGWRYYQSTQAPEAPVPVALPQPSTPAEPEPAAPMDANAPPPGIANPVDDIAVAEDSEDSAGDSALPALDASDDVLNDRLNALLGSDNVLRFLQLDGFVRRTVATIDNLPRQLAPAAAWPVNPTPQRFTVQQGPDNITTIAPDNAARYTPLVQLVEAVDTGKAVALYRSLYPLFQTAYEELGYPDRYFNDRLVQVLDHLIATPVPTGPLAVTLVEVKGEVPSTRPWVRYEYANPELESLSAGRKVLLRVGPDNHRRLQAKLVDIRQRVARP
ncbi:MAG: DUF3014 domain-containing protein [Hydrogenophaga sp.]|nr:DUF3014 domain-containing protein [Hydrogenophaga sp.]